MGRSSLPPGFRFHPTHVELIMFYLKRKVMQKKLPLGIISDLDIYKYAPWDLPDKSSLKSGDLKWYFFCPRERKYASGARMNRATEFGYWKSTGKDRPVLHNNEVVGQIKTLTFFRGKPRKGEQTDWVMHEYRFEEENQTNVAQGAYVLCVIFEKEGPGPRNGAQYGAPFKEEEWDSDVYGEVDSVEVFSSGQSVPSVLPHNKEPESSLPPDTIASQSYIFGRSSGSCKSEILPSTSKEIPQVTGGDIALLETPQTLEFDDFVSIEDLLPEDGNLDLNCGDGNQSTQIVTNGTFAASNYLDDYDIFNDLDFEDIGISVGLNEGWYTDFTGHEAMCCSDQILASDEAMFRSDPMPFLELNDLEAPLNSTAEVTNYEGIQISNFTAAYDCSKTVEQPCPSIPFETVKLHLPSCQSQYPSLLNNSIDQMCYPADFGFPDQHMSAYGYSSWQENVDDHNLNEGCNIYKAPWM